MFEKLERLIFLVSLKKLNNFYNFSLILSLSLSLSIYIYIFFFYNTYMYTNNFSQKFKKLNILHTEFGKPEIIIN